MDFEFNEEHKMLRRTVHAFVEEEIKPLARQIDEEARIPEALIKALAELGVFGVTFPEEYGGSDFGEIGYCIVVEELTRGSSSVAVMVGAHESLACTGIYLDGSEELKQRYLKPMARGEKIGAFALTEPEAGSDAGALRTTAEETDGSYLLNGTKIYITNGDIADVIVVFAVTDKTLGARGGITAFVVESEMDGFAVEQVEEKMGIRGARSAQLSFTDVEVPAENVIGEVGAGFKTAMQVLDRGRLGLAAGCVGAAKELINLSLAFAQEREQFDRPIAQHQAIQFMLAEMTAQTYAMESFTYRTAWLHDSGRPFTRESAITKLVASEMLDDIVDKAVQIHGGMGYMTEYPIERFYRDARINRIFEGTSEIQKLVIFRRLADQGSY
ncbi:MAG: acyl-CoA dehydrogenase family protein [Candidatus Bipolaricaulia bacterium]